MALKGILAHAQIRDGSVTKALLEPAVQTTLDNVPVIETNLTNLIDSKGQPNGLATLNGTGVLPAAQTGSIALHGYAGEVNSEAEMLALTQNVDGTDIEKGDRVDRLDMGRTLVFSGGDTSDAANWRPILAENAAVTAIRNAAGTTSETGVVTLSNLAFTGAIADLTGAAPVASSGAAGDVSVADAADKFTATDAEGVFAELDDKVNQTASDAATAATNAQNTAISQSRMGSHNLLPGANASTWSFDGLDVNTGSGIYFRVERNGVDEKQNGLAIVDQAAKTVSFSYDVLSDEAVTIVGYPQ